MTKLTVVFRNFANAPKKDGAIVHTLKARGWSKSIATLVLKHGARLR